MILTGECYLPSDFPRCETLVGNRYRRPDFGSFYRSFLRNHYTNPKMQLSGDGGFSGSAKHHAEIQVQRSCFAVRCAPALLWVYLGFRVWFRGAQLQEGFRVSEIGG